MKSIGSLIFPHEFDCLGPSVIRSHLKNLGLVFCFWDLSLLEVTVLLQQKGIDLTLEMSRRKTDKMLTESFLFFYETLVMFLELEQIEYLGFFKLSLPLH